MSATVLTSPRGHLHIRPPISLRLRPQRVDTSSSPFRFSCERIPEDEEVGTAGPHHQQLGQKCVLQTAGAVPRSSKAVKNCFEFHKMIYAGNFTRVYKSTVRKTGQNVAVKYVSKKAHRKPHDVLVEVAALRVLQSHPNIISLVCAYETPTMIVMGMEWHRNGNLLDFMEKCPNMLVPSHLIRQMFRGIALGVAHCHRHGIVHRDLKPENIIISKDLTPLITDFGLAVYASMEESSITSSCDEIVGSIPYLSPECLMNERNGATPYSLFPGDIWGLGCILYSMGVGELAFHAVYDVDSSKRAETLDSCFAFTKTKIMETGLPLSGKKLLLEMLERNTLKRITIRGVTAHNFVRHGWNPSAMEIRVA